jgi:hypothetical protein
MGDFMLACVTAALIGICGAGLNLAVGLLMQGRL